MRKWMLAAAAVATMFASSAGAIELRSGMGGAQGYGTDVLFRNDDSSDGPLPMPFSINFFGNTYNSFYLNNNGNITFNGPVGAYTPQSFPISSQPMIAPFWADVDTRCASCGTVTVGSQSPNSFSVTWHDVGYYSNHANITNDFQLTLTNAGSGDFDVEFRYNRLDWTTGDASGGTGGFGGTPAQAGFDAGNGVNFLELPGSFSSDILNLETTSNVGTAGLWQFSVRNGGEGDGSSAATPLQPNGITGDGGYHFDFGVTANQMVFIDPLVAAGYDYRVLSGPNILSALFPVFAGQGAYQLFSLDGLTSLGTAFGGSIFNFASGGVNGFQLRGINTSLGLDPLNPLAFVTGLTFDVGTGVTNISMTQTPYSVDTGGAVPEPATWAMMILGLGAIGAVMRSRRRAALAFA